MYKKLKLMSLLICVGLVVTEELTQDQQEVIREKTLEEFAKIIFSNAMEAKRAFQQTQVREEIIENFATTAPRSDFMANADIAPDLAAGVESATVYVSTDNQSTWSSGLVGPLGTEGYENTWGGTIFTSDGTSAHSYISGDVNSEVLDYDYGTIIVSGSPHNEFGNWPPGFNMYAEMADEPSGDASSSQDIVALRASYKNNASGEVERFYVDLGLNASCCEEGGFFGPWYIYGVGIVNPESDASDGSAGTAYAIGYGDGGVLAGGELYPGILKISGVLATGELDGFEYLSTNISYSTSGNDMQASALMSILTNDPDWGTWPNSYGGFIVLGVTVEAALSSSLDVEATILDDTNPGLLICDTSHQNGNALLSLSNPSFDSETNTLSVTYQDDDGNLPWWKDTQVCAVGGAVCYGHVDMIPSDHTYQDGVVFSGSFEGEDFPLEWPGDGDYEAHFWFADDDIENYPSAQIILPISVGSNNCGSEGDITGDGVVNVLDVVSLVSTILGGTPNECADITGDGVVNVLDVVLLVNIILGPDGL